MISVVIVTYNSEACIQNCVEAVIRCLPTAEILVIDNASTDASRDIARRAGASVISLTANLGFGRACNIGAERCTLDHVLFLNPDVSLHSVDAGALEALINEQVFGLVVPASERTHFVFNERPWIAESISLILRTLRPRELPRRTSSLATDKAVWVSAAALLVRKAEFLNAGGFDARYFLYYEDRDLSWRYRNRGLPLRTSQALLADHAGGGSSELTDRRANIGAFAILGWVQYQCSARGTRTARHSWTLLRSAHRLIAGLLDRIARFLPSQRIRRKSLQLHEIAHELDQIHTSSGILAESDGNHYWPGALNVLGNRTLARAPDS